MPDASRRGRKHFGLQRIRASHYGGNILRCIGWYSHLRFSFLNDIKFLLLFTIKGASYGPNIRNWLNTRTKANLGQCFIAVDPGCFAPGFEARLSDLMTHFRQMEPVG